MLNVSVTPFTVLSSYIVLFNQLPANVQKSVLLHAAGKRDAAGILNSESSLT